MSDRRSYERLLEDDDYPADAVIVGIGWEPELVPLAEPTAMVMLPDGWMDGPFDVPMALFRADEVMMEQGCSSVRISIASAEHWQETWGDLVD